MTIAKQTHTQIETNRQHVPAIPAPLPAGRALLIFLSAGFLLRLTIYQGLPALITLGLTPFAAFLVTFTVPVGILFALALGAIKAEGVPLTWPAVSRRLRLRPFARRGWLWLPLMLIAALLGGVLLSPTRGWIIPLLPPLPQSFPPLLNPSLQNDALITTIQNWLQPQELGDPALIFLTVQLFLLNLFGEELFWRGVILPRQERVHGRWTWLVHGVMWNLFHLPLYPWYLIFGLGVTLPISFAAQKTGSTWAALILHGVGNLYLYGLIIATIAAG